MCEGFAVIVDKELNLYFCEPEPDGDCSHSEILSRLGWRETGNAHLRRFVRVEYADWTPESIRFDENASLPGWCEANKETIHARCDRLLNRCAPAWAEYEKVRAPAWAEYAKATAPAWAEYNKVRAPAWAEYNKVRDQALEECAQVFAQAWAEYNKVRDQALAEYMQVRAQALAEYERVRAPALAKLIAKFQIKGYVAEKGEL
jgi:hypothetical protein